MTVPGRTDSPERSPLSDASVLFVVLICAAMSSIDSPKRTVYRRSFGSASMSFGRAFAVFAPALSGTRRVHLVSTVSPGARGGVRPARICGL